MTLWEKKFRQRTFPVDLLNCGLEAVPEHHVIRVCHVSELAHVAVVCWEILSTFTRKTHHSGGFIDNHETGGGNSFEE